MRLGGRIWWLAIAVGVGAFLLAPGPLSERLMAIAAGVCPQRPSHSYFLGGTPLPLEARMTGIFGGFLVAVVWQWLAGAGGSAPLPSRRAFAGLMGLVGVMGIDALNASSFDLGLPYLYRPENAIRLATGLLAGVATGLLFLPVVNAWTWSERPAGGHLGRGWPARAMGLLAVSGLIWLAVVDGWAWAFYPLALLSTAGLVLAVAMLNLLLVFSVRPQRGKVDGLGALGDCVALALALAATELTALAALRWAVVGPMGP